MTTFLSEDSDQLQDLRKRMLQLNTTDIHTCLRQLREILANFQLSREELKSDIEFQRSELPLFLKNLVQAKKDLTNLKNSVSSSINLAENDSKSLRFRMKQTAPDLLLKLDQLYEMQTSLLSLRTVRQIVNLASKISLALQDDDWDEVYANYEMFMEEISSIRKLEFSDKLLHLANLSLNEMNNRLGKELESALGECLDNLNYPFQDMVDLNAHRLLIGRLKQLLRCMHEINPETKERDEFGRRKSTVLESMLEPMRKRFHFHFYGDRKTNEPSKPEWFYTQLVSESNLCQFFVITLLAFVFPYYRYLPFPITWAQAHAQLFSVHIQSVVSDREISAIFALHTCLISLASEKVRDIHPFDLESFRFSIQMSEIIDQSIENPVRYSHLIDETVIFEIEMNAIGYPETAPNVLDFLAKEERVDKWLELERYSCTGKVETLLMATECWKDRLGSVAGNFNQEVCVPECADSFVTLLQLMTERYRLLRESSVKVQFLQMQLQLLDDFRMRVLQIARNITTAPWEAPFPQLMNAFWYIAQVLEEWNDLPFFVHLKASISGGKQIRGAFDEMIELYKHGWRQFSSSLTKFLVDRELKDLLQVYANQKCPPLYTNCAISIMHLSRHLRCLTSYLEKYSQFQPSSLSIQQYVNFGRTGTAASSYLFLKKELLVRLANIMQEINLLPQDLLKTSSVRLVNNWYEESFADLLIYEQTPAHLDQMTSFNEDLQKVLARHAHVVETMAEGLIELNNSKGVDLASEKGIQYFLDRFYLNRISIRMLMNQHYAFENARFLCERYYLIAPNMKLEVTNSVDCTSGITLVAVPSHLYHIIFELLKNAMRATVEQHGVENDPPDIRVFVVKGKEDISFKICDRGGGVSRIKVDLLFNYMYSTAPPPSKDGTQAPLAGYGYGLPLSRLYARYFQGDLFLVSMEGLGTDACVYLKALPPDAIEVLPIFNTWSKRLLTQATKARDWSHQFPGQFRN